MDRRLFCALYLRLFVVYELETAQSAQDIGKYRNHLIMKQGNPCRVLSILQVRGNLGIVSVVLPKDCIESQYIKTFQGPLKGKRNALLSN